MKAGPSWESTNTCPQPIGNGLWARELEAMPPGMAANRGDYFFPQGLQGFFAAHGLQGFFALQGLQGFFAAQGLHGFFAAHGLHGFFAAHGLQGFFAAHGLHGLHGFAAEALSKHGFAATAALNCFCTSPV